MKIVLETEPRNLPALDITLLINGLKSCCCSIIGRATSWGRWIMPSSNAGWSTAAGLHARVLQGYAEEIQMLAQQYADDKEKWRC